MCLVSERHDKDMRNDNAIVAVKKLILDNGHSPFDDWVRSIKDTSTRARIQRRLERIGTGNLGDAKPVGGEVFELRLDFGPGYRIYFGRVGATLVVLIGGGDKSTQQRDIDRAIKLWEDFSNETR